MASALSLCTYSGVEATSILFAHFMEFYDGDIMKVAESFGFYMMAQTLVFRDITLMFAEHGEAGDRVGLAKDITRLVKALTSFHYLYKDQKKSKPVV